MARATPDSPHAKSAASLITAPTQARLYFNRPLADAALLAVAARADRLVTVAADRRVSSHRWLQHAPLEAGTAPPFHIDPSRAPRLGFGVPFAGDQRHATTRFAASSDGRLLYSCGYWDHSLKATQLADGRSVQSLRPHTDVVRCAALRPPTRESPTAQPPSRPASSPHSGPDPNQVSCLALSDDGGTLVTGSRDTTLMVRPQRSAPAFPSLALTWALTWALAPTISRSFWPQPWPCPQP